MPRQLPLTFQQQWLLDFVTTHERWQCVAASAFRFKGTLDTALLHQCLNEVVRRNDALRTRIVMTDGLAQQEILDPEPYSLGCTRVGGSCGAEIESTARQFVEALCDERMDVSAGPLWKATLLELNKCEYWLVLAMHRLIGDCASIDQTYNAVHSSYREASQGWSIPPSSQSQYSDYTSWQQKICSGWSQRHEPYWKRSLDGAVPLEWPVDPNVAVTSPDILGKVSCSFGAALGASLHDLARKMRTLGANVMLSLYVVALWRWCLQKDFVLPFNVAGRSTEYKSAIGYFSYSLYLRMRLTGEETFRDLVKSVANEFFGGLTHQDFGRIARQRPELLSGTLFQWLTWHPDDATDTSSSVSSDSTKQAIERVTVRDFGEGLTVVPPGATSLEITVFDTPSGLRAFGSYRANQFTRDTMERFMEEFRSVTEFFVRDPDARIAVIGQAGGGFDGAVERESDEAQCRTELSLSEFDPKAPGGAAHSQS